MPWLLCFVTFLIPAYIFRLTAGPIKTNVFELVLLICLIIGICLAIFNKVKYQRTVKWGGPWPYLMVLAAAIAFIYAPDHYKALGILKGWFIFPVAYFWLLINFIERPQVRNLLYSLMAGLLVVSVWGLSQFAGVKVLLDHQLTNPDLAVFLKASPKRIFSIFESPNYLAMYVEPLIFLGLILILETKKPVLILTVTGLAIINLFLTESRAGTTAFLMAISAILLIDSRAKKDRVFTVLSIFLILIFSLVIIRNAFNPDKYLSNKWRGKIYHYSAIMVKERPILGDGLGGYQEKLAQTARNDQEFLDYGLSYAYHPHNIFLAFWLNLGLLGLVVFIGTLVSYFKMVVSLTAKHYEKLALTAAMLTIIIHGVFDTPYFKNDLSAIFWLLYALPFILAQTTAKTSPLPRHSRRPNEPV